MSENENSKISEKECLKEFESWWKKQKIIGCYSTGKLTWLESRRRFIAQLKKDSKLAGFDIEEWEEEGG
jgi:hypothetical protein